MKYRLISLAALVAALCSVAATQSASSNPVHAVFDLATPTGGPFPSDWFTVADVSHLTGRRVSLPYPDCVERPSDCEDLDVLNALDGFNLQPRLSIPFDGSIDVTTVNSRTVFLLALTCHDDGNRDDEAEEECDDADHRGVTFIGINQVVWDPASTTLHVKSDELLDQHARYALVVTRGIRDDVGRSVEATDTFRRFRQTVHGAYKRALLDAIHAARRSGVRDEAYEQYFHRPQPGLVARQHHDCLRAQYQRPYTHFCNAG